MAIPEAQLNTWSHQGSVAQSRDTYAVIRNCLDAPDVPYAGKPYEIFLQGSYGNDTNIYAESDVDIVIQMNDGYYYDLDPLDEADKASFIRTLSPAAYTHAMFKDHVVAVLANRFGADVSVGNKAIAIAARGNRRKADVVVATKFHRYSRFRNDHDESHFEGLCFWDRSNNRIVNYPKIHSANLTAKHQATGQWLKPTIRIMKNFRSFLVDARAINPADAPSYFLEGLLYNMPTNRFGGSYATTVASALHWYQTEAVKDQLVCANERFYLLRDNSQMCWAPASADRLVNAAVAAWNRW